MLISNNGKKKFADHQVDFLEAKEVSDGYFTITLSKEDVNWEPGQYANFSIIDAQMDEKDWRSFSFASIVEDDVIEIGTRSIGEMSEFKHALLSLKKGDKVNVKGPFGRFTLKDNETPVVFIALGIGITPIRSLLKEIDHKNHHQKVHVVYSSEGYFIFRDELDIIAKNHQNIELTYPTTIDETKEDIDELAKQYHNEANYYIAGPPKAVKSVKNALIEEGIQKDNILHDPFTGY